MSVEDRLKGELRRIEERLGTSSGLCVEWLPGHKRDLLGESMGGHPHLRGEKKKALEALRHELMDYLLTSRLVEPLISLLNLLIKAREEEIYARKEELVERLARLL